MARDAELWSYRKLCPHHSDQQDTGVMFQQFETIVSTSLPLAPMRHSWVPAALAGIGVPESDFGAYVGSEWKGGIVRTR